MLIQIRFLGGVTGYKVQLDIARFSSVDMTSLEAAFQSKNLREYWIHNFGSAAYEGVALCYRHTEILGDGIWITSDGLRIIRRDTVQDNGTWYGWYVFRL